MSTVVTFDNAISGQIPDGTSNVSFTVGSNPNTLVMFAQYQSPLSSTPPSTPTFAGQTMFSIIGVSGPRLTDFGLLNVWGFLNASSGSQTISINNPTDSVTRQYVVYSYYNAKGVDISGGNASGYTSGNVTTSLTALSNNTLMWGVGGARSNLGNNPQVTQPPNNNIKVVINNPNIGAGDFGVQATPTSESIGVGLNSDNGGGCVALVAILGSQDYSSTLTTGMYSLTGIQTILTKFRSYFISPLTGVFNLSGESTSLTFTPYKWKFVSKSTTPSSWTDVPKSVVPTSTSMSGGQPIGLLLALTQTVSTISSGWNSVSKAVLPTSWTDVPKAN